MRPASAQTSARTDLTKKEGGSASPLLGSACLLFGAVVVCLMIIDRTAGLPFRMPRSWYVSRPLWYVIVLAAFLAGYFLLRNRRYFAETWRADRPGIRFERVVLYTKPGCHLCDLAKDTILKYQRYLPNIEEIDIETDPDLNDRFATCIPVVEIDGKIRFRAEISEALLRRLIEGAPPRDS